MLILPYSLSVIQVRLQGIAVYILGKDLTNVPSRTVRRPLLAGQRSPDTRTIIRELLKRPLQ